MVCPINPITKCLNVLTKTWHYHHAWHSDSINMSSSHLNSMILHSPSEACKSFLFQIQMLSFCEPVNVLELLTGVWLWGLLGEWNLPDTSQIDFSMSYSDMLPTLLAKWSVVVPLGPIWPSNRGNLPIPHSGIWYNNLKLWECLFPSKGNTPYSFKTL